jgi:superfamily II DNA or RNA helicase/SAM-dependent methyltransferase
MTDTLAYYNNNAGQFFAETVEVEMFELHNRFLAHVPAVGQVLDAGCGSGRDSKAFLRRGYQVTTFDASPKLAELASKHLGHPVAVRTFAEVVEKACYDGIWACASLLHLPQADIPDALVRLWGALKPGGAFYLSFKLGAGERQHAGRHYTDANEPRLRIWLGNLPDIADLDIWLSEDQRPGRKEQWINAIAKRRPASSGKLVTGGDDPFLPHLCSAINHATEVDLAVAFIKTTGLRLLLPDLHSALTPGEESTREPAQIRVITSDYLDVTDPDALRHLILLQEQGAQVRVYESAGSSFHMKAYLFASSEKSGGLRGTAFIGSSNISRQALQNGLEWNYRIDYPGDDGFLEARRRYDELFAHPRTVALSDAWIDSYEARRVAPPFAVAPGSQEREAVPQPTQIQTDALAALAATRQDGFSRGLVVLATGLGKTWLSAFDAQQTGAQRVLFVAHREEILSQAAETFLRIRPKARVGFYMGKQRDIGVDVLCASVQTLSRASHLERFTPQHFDYIIIDEFHHADAPTYRRLLNHFSPRFLLGLTATPDRTDQSDILSLCDDNLVFTCKLFAGIEAGLLAPFHYFGIFDDAVDYREIPWRNGRFDPEQLSNKLATLARARHALRQWQQRAQVRTLAFCVSIRHAEFMAEHFTKAGVVAAAVYGGSLLSRGDALEQLRNGRLQVIFSVDLFSEGVDLPAIDTVMMLRPTESKILFLQQLGRGLRKVEGKERLVVLDFIGNHHSFLHKPQALMETGATYKQLAEFARNIEEGRLALPEGCRINYDLQIIDFLKSLDGEGIQKDYEALRQGLGRRPSLTEFYRAGANISRMRQQYGSWFELVNTMGDLDTEQAAVAMAQQSFLRELETTAMTKSYKMVLVEALQELNGWHQPPTLAALAERSWQVLQRRRPLLMDLPDELRGLPNGSGSAWQNYWRDNPVNAWVGGKRSAAERPSFAVANGCLAPTFSVTPKKQECFSTLIQELVDYRLAAYEVRRTAVGSSDNVIPLKRPVPSRTELPYFPNLKIACGHFKVGNANAEEYRTLGLGYGQLNPDRHFIARASGNSMDGGKRPIHDGDYLLLERVQPSNAGSITGSVMAIERQDESGDNQYLLRVVTKTAEGRYILKANNPAYTDLAASDEMRTLARLKAVIDPLEIVIGQTFMREEIPPLFGVDFNPGSWNSGHVVLNDQKAHILLVTLNKQGKAEDHRYLDHWIDEQTFHWQSQNATTPSSKRGQEIVEHEKRGIAIHLFVREAKLAGGKGAPFLYHGPVRYRSHTGTEPMSVIFEL